MKEQIEQAINKSVDPALISWGGMVAFLGEVVPWVVSVLTIVVLVARLIIMHQEYKINSKKLNEKILTKGK